jgi:hypothetical protein
VALLSRWPRPPASFRSLLQGNERVVGAAATTDSFVVATQLGLWLPEPAGEGWRRIGWDRIVKATWQDGRLEVVEGDLGADGVVIDRPAVSVALVEPGNLPSVVRARVEGSIARSEQVSVPGGTGRVVARRVPGVDGLSWTARLDSGTPDSPAAHEALADYRRQAVESATAASFPD